MLEELGHVQSEGVTVEPEMSKSPKITKLLKNASKKGGADGFPDFIITFEQHHNLLIVIECKGDTRKHRTTNLNMPVEYACDGALHYASFLSKEYDVIAIGVSGESTDDLLVSTFLHLRGKLASEELDTNALLSPADYYSRYITSPQKFNEDYSKLLSYTQDLNNELHEMKVKESQRSLFISAVLICLQNDVFRVSYSKHKSAANLCSSIYSTVKSELQDDTGIPDSKVRMLESAYAFITTHSKLSSDKTKLVELINTIDEKVNGFMRTHRYFDTIGQFYIEFLRYANNDKGLGIVLTPPHITELFAELAGVDESSVVFDNCCGTGGFLISAMKSMVNKCGGDSKKIKDVKTTQLIGVESQDDIYALAISNMILQDDGKSNIKLGDCFTQVKKLEQEVTDKKIKRPNVGFLNPPYKNKSQPSDPEELEFVLNNLALLERGSLCFSLIPISCVLAQSGRNYLLKQKIMENHTVVAVMSLPEDLFHNSKASVVTCILVIKAKEKHRKGQRTWLAYWRDDGFEKVRHKGRIDASGKWGQVKDKWVNGFINQTVEPGVSVFEEVTPEDEWCAEEFLETDYSTITVSKVLDHYKRRLAYELVNDEASS